MEGILWTSGLAAVGLLSFVVWRLVQRYRRSSGPWLVECPECEVCTEITLDTGTRLGTGARVKQCSHWPELAGCGEQCVR